jgi:hypothetical protein
MKRGPASRKFDRGLLSITLTRSVEMFAEDQPPEYLGAEFGIQSGAVLQ